MKVTAFAVPASGWLDEHNATLVARCPWVDPVSLNATRAPTLPELIALAREPDLTVFEARQVFSMSYAYFDAWVELRDKPAFLRVLQDNPRFAKSVEEIREFLDRNAENPAYVLTKEVTT